METNTIYCGDNLEIISKFPDEYIDLIYADPPFFSGKNYEIIWGDSAEKRQFDDRFSGDINWYIEWMTSRLAQCHRVLKNTGSMYLHCDWHANAHLRIAMDKIFRESKFRNEIIWEYYQGGKSQNKFGCKHDTILYYTKSNNWIFNNNAVRQPYATSTIERYKTPLQDGKIHKLNPDGKIISDVWSDIHSISRSAKERTGYPTQKPEALLIRIIEASSNKGNIILDPFCGCGTTIVVAQYLQRKWIGIDVSPTACKVMARRLEQRGYSGVKIIGLPTTLEELKQLKPFEFQNWIINKVNGTHSNKKSGDLGIDGYTFQLREPIQVKQSEGIGRNIVDNFETAIRRDNKSKGYIYAFSFSKSAYEETARARQSDSMDIQLIEIKDIL